MTRIQIARDIRMARSIAQAALPGKVVVLLAGSGHVNRLLGVPQHLPPGMKLKSVQLRAEPDAPLDTEEKAAFDAVWMTPALPERDYCKDVLQKPGAK